MFKGNSLKIAFDFRVYPDIRFKPEIIIKNVPKARLKKIGERAINNFVFHLGLIEIPSYWKATCSPEIIIEAGYLNKEQIDWWQDLVIKGMGQFFYENKIDFRKPDLLEIKCRSSMLKSDFNKLLKSDFNNRYLVPFAGGRDSIVTLEKLKGQKKEMALFLVNPNEQIKKTAKASGVKKQIVVERKIDPSLLQLNKKGYLNGHTPFTALLSFLSVFCAVLFDHRNVVFSNEKSADEGNIRYLGRVINHQWAKSSEFEKRFRFYCRKYLAEKVNYLNFLRKYGELEISKMFARYPKYFPVFSSCNAAMKIKSSVKSRWCGKCPKCLFVYLTLCPYLKKKEILKIFGEDLLKKQNLLPVLKSLIGKGRHKPFECVGTYAEARKALNLCLKSLKKN